MLLAVDVGNTSIHFGVYDGAERIAQYRVLSEQARTADEWDVLLSLLLARRKIEWERITRAALCSVVPAVDKPLAEALRQRTGQRPLFLGMEVNIGFESHYDAALGADRFVNAAGVFVRRILSNCIVIDFGTATKVEAVAASGVHLGGAILPGVGISLDALYRQASKLSSVELTAPRSIIGTNTADALRAGVLHGFGAQAEGLVERFKIAAKWSHVRVIATGGYAELIAPFAPSLTDVQPFWTLDSICLIAERVAGH